MTLGGLSGCSSTSQNNKDQVNVNSPADKILVKKSEHKLYLLKNGEPIRTYRVSLGSSPKGHKERQGDNRTPEGVYYIDGRNPGSRFHKALSISYPSPKDRAEAARRGVAPGGQIMIHGYPAGGPVARPARPAHRDGLDGRLHRRDQPGHRGDLAPYVQRDPHRDRPLRAQARNAVKLRIFRSP